MTLRFRKSFGVMPGIRINLGKRGLGVSAGVRGARITLGQQGVRGTAGLPGTGLSYNTRFDHRPRSKTIGWPIFVTIALVVLGIVQPALLFAIPVVWMIWAACNPKSPSSGVPKGGGRGPSSELQRLTEEFKLMPQPKIMITPEPQQPEPHGLFGADPWDLPLTCERRLGLRVNGWEECTDEELEDAYEALRYLYSNPGYYTATPYGVPAAITHALRMLDESMATTRAMRARGQKRRGEFQTAGRGKYWVCGIFFTRRDEATAFEQALWENKSWAVELYERFKPQPEPESVQNTTVTMPDGTRLARAEVVRQPSEPKPEHPQPNAAAPPPLPPPHEPAPKPDQPHEGARMSEPPPNCSGPQL